MLAFGFKPSVFMALLGVGPTIYLKKSQERKSQERKSQVVISIRKEKPKQVVVNKRNNETEQHPPPKKKETQQQQTNKQTKITTSRDGKHFDRL